MLYAAVLAGPLLPAIPVLALLERVESGLPAPWGTAVAVVGAVAVLAAVVAAEVRIVRTGSLGRIEAWAEAAPERWTG